MAAESHATRCAERPRLSQNLCAPDPKASQQPGQSNLAGSRGCSAIDTSCVRMVARELDSKVRFREVSRELRKVPDEGPRGHSVRLLGCGDCTPIEPVASTVSNYATTVTI